MTARNSTLTAERLRALLDYDPETGVFTRKVRTSNRIRSGDIAGTRNPPRYTLISIEGIQYRAHRLAWLYVYGEWPSEDLDHINRVKTDNRLCNLRLATRKQNMENNGPQKNNRLGIRGVYWDVARKKWAVTIHHHGRTIAGGRFDSVDSAKARRAQLENRFFTRA